ncbi:MAG: hypothetical protein L3K17_01710, partial [Thermoplasmata archaeon]|nr:hypothetical protein [Thermoplasmata archaeon]
TRRGSYRRVALVVLGAVAFAGIMVLSGAGPAQLTGRGATPTRSLGGVLTVAGSSAGPAATLVTLPSSTTTAAVTDALQLGITAAPGAICASGTSSCGAGTDTARVTLTADAGGAGQLSWPAVQVAFVVETTLYDGVFDPSNTGDEPGYDPCAAPAGSLNTACEESNGVPYFTVNAQLIANSIAAANPHTTVSFAMVDYFATQSDWNDGDGVEYHVDIPTFVPSSTFGQAVTLTFRQEVLLGHLYYEDSDFADNILSSSSITALYGTIVGSGLNWANDTHHVIVWLGSTAPRDPNYLENYCVSANTAAAGHFGSCDAATCEPSNPFPTGASPNCEGWVKSQDGNATHSIAALAKSAKSCTDSVGGVCTVDTIDYWTTSTDPYSEGWPTRFSTIGGGPGGLAVIENVVHVLEAGCDLAAATGGTWDGPAFWTCPNGQVGTLQYVTHGSYNNPNTNNPTLFAALRQIGFGPVLNTQVASGSGHPIFSYVPIGNIAIAPNLQASAACQRGGETFQTCQLVPVVLHSGSTTYLGWNWSTNKSLNTMYVGDFWTASFNIIANGPPYASVPVDACITIYCKAGGSNAVGSLYTWASYVPASNNTIVTDSFPLATIHVETGTPTTLGTAPPPPPPVPPPFAIPTAPPVPVVQQLGVSNTIGVGNVSLQAAAAGFLGAGFMRVSMKNKPIAMRVAAKAGPLVSRFDNDAMKGVGVGRFE